tara:strand:+ start:451 stop:1566 length:1116 start_codon:yes stop_codon:yes gene_type:complete
MFSAQKIRSPTKESLKSPLSKVKSISFGPKSPRKITPVAVRTTRRANDRNTILKNNCLRSITNFLVDRKILINNHEEVAQKWSEWCTDIGSIIKEDSENKKTKLPEYLEEWDGFRGSTRKNKVSEGKGISFDGTLVFSKGDMIQYAYDLERIKQEGQVAILNMANARVPGGGYFSGSNAQEEQLCLRSDLLPRIKLAQKYGKYGLKIGETLYTNNVTLLRNSDLKDVDNEYVHVVSAAAINYSHQPTQLKRDVKSGAIDIDIQRTWRNIIYAASTMGDKDLVISVIGAGAFNNPLENVINGLLNALNTLIEPTNGMVIHLVVMNDKNGSKNSEKTEKLLKEQLKTIPHTYNVQFNEGKAPVISRARRIRPL